MGQEPVWTRTYFWFSGPNWARAHLGPGQCGPEPIYVRAHLGPGCPGPYGSGYKMGPPQNSILSRHQNNPLFGHQNSFLPFTWHKTPKFILKSLQPPHFPPKMSKILLHIIKKSVFPPESPAYTNIGYPCANGDKKWIQMDLS